MTNIIKLYFTIRNGQRFYERPSLLEALKEYENKRLCESISLAHEPTTSDQRGYYRASNRWLIDHTDIFTGYSEDDIHNLFLGMFSTYTKNYKIGEKHYEIKSIIHTSDMTKKQMNDFITRRNIWIEEQGIIIPDSESIILGKYRTVKK